MEVDEMMDAGWQKDELVVGEIEGFERV